MVQAAVKQNGMALRFTSDSLKQWAQDQCDKAASLTADKKRNGILQNKVLRGDSEGIRKYAGKMIDSYALKSAAKEVTQMPSNCLWISVKV